MKKRLLTILMLLLLILPLKGEKEPEKVLIDNYHSNNTSNPVNDLKIFKKILEENNYKVEIKKEIITRELLKNYKVLILANPYKPLDAAEIEAIVEFVDGGGGLLMVGVASTYWNDEARESYNTLALNFGFRFMKSTIDDKTDNTGCHCTPIFHNINSHEITFGVRKISFSYPASIEVKNAIILAYGDDDTNGSYNIGDEKVYKEDVVAAVATSYGRGNVVGLGSLSIFEKLYIEMDDNATFAINIVNWLAKGEKIPDTNDSKVVIVTNSIDRNLEFENYLKENGLEIVVVSPLEFESYKNNKFIIILGGPDAPETGVISQEVLSEIEESYLRERFNSNAYLKRDIWRENQFVFVLAGNDRNLTREVILKVMQLVYQMIVENS